MAAWNERPARLGGSRPLHAVPGILPCGAQAQLELRGWAPDGITEEKRVCSTAVETLGRSDNASDMEAGDANVERANHRHAGVEIEGDGVADLSRPTAVVPLGQPTGLRMPLPH